MRTVRAFAGEENEARMFAEECEVAADLSMELGLGVGLFQAGTNLFLNGYVFYAEANEYVTRLMLCDHRCRWTSAILGVQ